jgi:N-glycosylase/DNA lyase
MEFSIPTPQGFSFKRTAISHGWCELPPFEFDPQLWTLKRVVETDGRPVTVTISGGRRALTVRAPRRLGARTLERVTRDVRHMLRLDDDMQEFYETVAREPDFAWISRSGAGRLLRSPTVFEDLVKTICTTNCSWSLTDKMVRSLVNALGRPSSDGRRGFPTPEAMASVDEKFYRDEMRSGYRAPYFKELAERVASGSLDVEAWLTSDLPTDRLKREMKQVKGVGEYAADNLLKLVGRYDGLALDSWVRGKFARTHNGGRAADDKKIARHYLRFGRWQGLALWCDMTRDWIGEDQQSVRW